MFCKHNWELLSKETTLSKFESSLAASRKYTNGNISLPHQLCNADRKLIQVFTCRKCGKIKKFVDNI